MRWISFFLILTGTACSSSGTDIGGVSSVDEVDSGNADGREEPGSETGPDATVKQSDGAVPDEWESQEANEEEPKAAIDGGNAADADDANAKDAAASDARDSQVLDARGPEAAADGSFPADCNSSQPLAMFCSGNPLCSDWSAAIVSTCSMSHSRPPIVSECGDYQAITLRGVDTNTTYFYDRQTGKLTGAALQGNTTRCAGTIPGTGPCGTGMPACPSADAGQD
jgi:hypothetical protein